MIVGIFHEGSGLGNQLARYVFTRVKAADLGVPFGMINPENFKGASFMKLDMGVPVEHLVYEYNEKKVVNEEGNDVRPYDGLSMFTIDNTLVDGEFQDEAYFFQRLSEVREWLKTEPIEIPDNICIINFRGGEYRGVSDLYLPKEYWIKAMKMMREINPKIKFEIHTDDVDAAEEMLGDGPIMKCVHNIGINWRSIRCAKYLILSNSSFAILPALLGEAETIIAPKYWAGYNKGYWQLPQNNYKKFTYIHHENI